jgi:hypothetical protein
MFELRGFSHELVDLGGVMFLEGLNKMSAHKRDIICRGKQHNRHIFTSLSLVLFKKSDFPQGRRKEMGIDTRKDQKRRSEEGT